MGKCVGGGVGKCVRMWEVCWGVGVVKKDVGCGEVWGRHGKP